VLDVVEETHHHRVGDDYARRVGLLPPEVSADRVIFCGNSSLAGAADVLAGRLSRAEIAEAADAVANVELATAPGFAEVFARLSRFPNSETFEAQETKSTLKKETNEK
ncbi:MAG: DUF4445 domain-containing protein, partial [Thermoguttaceae bacterium]|nr:DUF4445 domain-containing protein [Thermoguttaceae bacterium]